MTIARKIFSVIFWGGTCTSEALTVLVSMHKSLNPLDFGRVKK